MHDRDLYATILGIRAPWNVSDVQLRAEAGTVEVTLSLPAAAECTCPQCGRISPRYDTKPRRWRHLDTCQFKTFVLCEVPRVKCAEHGVHQIALAWAEPGSRFTALFEALIIDWLKDASIRAVARMMGLSWDEVDGVMARAVARGLARRKLDPPSRVGIDETSFAKRHEYVTVVCDLDSPTVVHVADDRKEESLDGYFSALSPEELARIEVVAMDMWEAYIASVREHVPDADAKIAFDKFHVAWHLGDAVNRIRAEEHRELRADGDDRLKGMRYLWLHGRENLDDRGWRRFEPLRRSNLKVARAWAIKETARDLWNFVRRGFAVRAWKKWLGWALRCRLEPVMRVARMIREHLHGIVNAIVNRVTSARSEGINAKIQWIKRLAFGFRNRDRFRRAIYFHLGWLDLYPAPLLPPSHPAGQTHTEV